MSNKTKQTPRQQAIAIAITLGAITLITLALLALSGALTPILKRKSSGLVSSCPIDPNKPNLFAYIDMVNTGSSKTTSYTFRFTVIDTATGQRKGREELGSAKNNAAFRCVGRGDGFVWIEKENTLQARDLLTAQTKFSWPDLQKKIPALANGIKRVSWVRTSSALRVQLPDANMLEINPSTLTASPFRGEFEVYDSTEMNPGQIRTDAIRFHVNGNERLVLKNGQRVTFRGYPRTDVMVGSKELTAGQTHYMPGFIPNDATNSVEWDGPASLMIVEETAIGSLIYSLKRISLSGSTLWTFTPPNPAGATWTGRPVPYRAMNRGSTIVTWTGQEIIGINPSTGKQLWSVDYLSFFSTPICCNPINNGEPKSGSVVICRYSTITVRGI